MRTLASLCALLAAGAVLATATPARAAHPAHPADAAGTAATARTEPLRPGQVADAYPGSAAWPHAGAATLVLAAGTGEKLPAKAEGAAADKAAPQIDINTATEQELATLHGIGEARARAIVKGRPYARKDELVRRKIIPQSVYDDIRDRIIAKQP